MTTEESRQKKHDTFPEWILHHANQELTSLVAAYYLSETQKHNTESKQVGAGRPGSMASSM
jgi:hypothetical protein